MLFSGSTTFRILALAGISILTANQSIPIAQAQEYSPGLFEVAEQATLNFTAIPTTPPNLHFVAQREDKRTDGSQDREPSPSDRGPLDDEDESDNDANGEAGENEEQDSDDSLAPMQNRDLSPKVNVVNLSFSGIGTGELPESSAKRDQAQAVMLPDGISRGSAFKCVHWRPSAICHYPLYFEDAMLERHGHVRFAHLQPLASGAKFFSTIALLPYLKTLQPTCEPRYALGHYRPGSCAPLVRDHLPWDKRAAAVQTLSAAGFFWAMPL